MRNSTVIKNNKKESIRNFSIENFYDLKRNCFHNRLIQARKKEFLNFVMELLRKSREKKRKGGRKRQIKQESSQAH